MSRIYWDTMLFAYWLEKHPQYGSRVDRIVERMAERGDTLVTSVIALGELLVLPRKLGDAGMEGRIESFFRSPSVQVLPFDYQQTHRFADVRAQYKIKSADAMHLATASTAGVDLFLTNDLALKRLVVQGIAFIDGIDTTVLDS
ncbi:type II toxin-antitoxin system VapC family toxin [Fimbriimonas ginsengisoli]|uniref:PilT protein n=1 Tax=Fimbriimonas ginsengisoli Gsoil 348 TaxID=661478 RepID=A0A068NY90_FIMGI|nr:PIN domain-containing protein [Fimbriimonas ginsengisoli]AIE86754.1 PilT protein [Fimbriimonas ginsengisoli Gsoil 348]